MGGITPAPPPLLFSANEDGTGGFTEIGAVRLDGVIDIAVSALVVNAAALLYGLE